jgi:hypothetical protein
MHIRSLIMIACLAGWAATLPAQTVGELPAKDIADLMSAEEFAAAGLHKLTPEERAALNSWLYGHVVVERREAVDAALPKGAESFGLEQVASKVAAIFRDTPEIIESRIFGEFRGWDGKTVFRLENGQVWQQAAPGRFVIRTKDPVILIRRGMLGSYLLKVEGYGTTVRVRRLE